MRIKSLMRGAAVGMILLSMLSAAGCAAKNAQQQDITIAVICKNETDEYWQSVWSACDDAESEMMIQTLRLAPDVEDIEKQIANINEAISANVDAIVLAAIDSDAENEALSKATSAGIPIVTIDSDINYDGRASYVGTQNISAAAIAGRRVKELLNNDGTVGVIYHGDTSTANMRMGGFMEEINPPQDENAEKPAGAGSKSNHAQPEKPASEQTVPQTNVKVLASVDGEGDMEISKDQAKKLITEQHVNLLYTTNQPGTRGACEAIQELIDAGTIQPDEVQLVGFDYFDGAYNYITSGVLDAVIVQNPYNMGYMGIRTARSVIQGEEVQPTIDTGAVLVTADNINEEHIQFLVNPTGN